MLKNVKYVLLENLQADPVVRLITSGYGDDGMMSHIHFMLLNLGIHQQVVHVLQILYLFIFLSFFIDMEEKFSVYTISILTIYLL